MNEKTSLFNAWVHRFGIVSSSILLLGMIAFPVTISALYGVWPSLERMWPAIVGVAAFMLPWLPGEIFGYMSIMGPGALYMSTITGNITNLRMPATVGTINSLGIEPNSDKCHTMSIIVCGGSIICSTVLVAAGVGLSSAITPILQKDFLQPAFNYVVPALFGGLVAQTVLKGSKHFLFYLVPLAICLFFCYVVPINSAYYMLIAIACSAALFIFDYKRGKAVAGTTETEAEL